MPMAANIPTMMMTTMSSINVKPCSFSGIIFLKVVKELAGDLGWGIGVLFSMFIVYPPPGIVKFFDVKV